MDDGAIVAVALTSTIALFVVLPAMVLHYITLWRRQKTLQPDDEQMMADLWRSAKAMERRLDTLEALLEAGSDDAARRPPRAPRTTPDE